LIFSGRNLRYNRLATLRGDKVLYFFNNYAIDPGRRELRSRGTLLPIEPQVFDLLMHLIQNRDRVISKDDLIASVWRGRIVSDSTLDSRINAARKAVGDSGQKQELIRTIPRKGFRFVGAVRQGEEQMEAGPVRSPVAEKQDISFCRTDDNINIAFASVGNGPPMLKTANWLTHLEYDWESPVWSPLLHWLAGKTRLVRYDSRGNGLSDRDADEISFDAFTRDFDCVVNASKLERFGILGISQGAAVAIDYAVRHPDRVSKLVLLGGYALGRTSVRVPRSTRKRRPSCRCCTTAGATNNPHSCGPSHQSFCRTALPNRSSGLPICSGTRRPRNAPPAFAVPATISMWSNCCRRSKCRHSCCIAATTTWCRSSKGA
jgi:DNA-binding winged helix-turn-helix (wHTH) protein